MPATEMVTSPAMTTPLSSRRLTRSTRVCSSSSPSLQISSSGASSALHPPFAAPASVIVGSGEVVRWPRPGELDLEADGSRPRGLSVHGVLEGVEASVVDQEGGMEQQRPFGGRRGGWQRHALRRDSVLREVGVNLVREPLGDRTDLLGTHRCLLLLEQEPPPGGSLLDPGGDRAQRGRALVEPPGGRLAMPPQLDSPLLPTLKAFQDPSEARLFDADPLPQAILVPVQ